MNAFLNSSSEKLTSNQSYQVNKSLITNASALLVLVSAYFIPAYKNQLMSIGLYALSGAVTNWLAIYMLFEKVPFLYGSGVIPNQFQEFKRGIHDLIMGQFFTVENVEKFVGQQKSSSLSIDFNPIIENLDFDKIFEKLVQAILQSPFGGMLGMFGGPNALVPLKEPFKEKIKEAIREMVSEESFQRNLQSQLTPIFHPETLILKVEKIVFQRLEELTPQLVKEIVEKMIHQHLGWLVVWGGVFGGLIGLLASFLK